MSLGNLDKFAGHAQPAGGRYIVLETRGHQPASGNAQVQGFIEALGTILQQHILADDANIRRSVPDIGGHIRAAQDNQADAVGLGLEYQFPTLVHVLKGRQTGCPQQRQRFLQNAPFGQSYCQLLFHSQTRQLHHYPG